MKKILLFALCSLLFTAGTYATAARPDVRSLADILEKEAEKAKAEKTNKSQAEKAKAEEAKQDDNEDDPAQESLILTRSEENPRILTLFGREFRLKETNENKEHYENFYAHSPEMNIRISKWKYYDCGYLKGQAEKENPLEVTTRTKNALVGKDPNTGNEIIYRFIQEYAACFELKMVVPSEMQISDEEEYDKTYYRAIFDTPKKTITNNIVKGKNRFWLEEDPTQERILRSSEDPRILALFMREFQLEETNEDKEHYENFYAHSPEMNIRISKWKMYDCGFRPDQALQEQEEKGNPLKVIQYDGTGEDIFLVGHNTSTGNDMIYRFIQDSDSCIELALTVSPETQIPVSTSYQAVRNTPKKTITKNVVKGNNRFGDETY